MSDMLRYDIAPNGQCRYITMYITQFWVQAYISPRKELESESVFFFKILIKEVEKNTKSSK